MFGDFGRTWKWAVPGFVFFVCLWFVIVLPEKGWGDVKAALGMLMVLCLAVGGTHYWRYVETERVELLYRRRQAEAITARGAMLEAAKGVHPETLKLVLGEQARRWGLVSGTKSPMGEPYAVLMARPRVTEAFTVYFLRNSMGKQYMSKHNKVSDGDRGWDPAGQVTAYEMYDDLVSLLEEEMKCTRPFGPTKPGYWLGEWSAAAVAVDYGVSLAVEDQEAAHTARAREDRTETGRIHEASAQDFIEMGVSELHAQNMAGLRQTPALLKKLQNK